MKHKDEFLNKQSAKEERANRNSVHENTEEAAKKEEESKKKKSAKPISSKDYWPKYHERQVHMSQFLFQVDTGFQEIEQYGTLVQASLSFTYMDWKMADQIRKGEVDIDDLTNSQV